MSVTHPNEEVWDNEILRWKTIFLRSKSRRQLSQETKFETQQAIAQFVKSSYTNFLLVAILANYETL